MPNIENAAGILESWDELEVLFTTDYWDIENALEAKPFDAKPDLSASELKLTANAFERGVVSAMNQEIAGIQLPEGVLLDPNHYPVGTLLLLDIETARQGVAPASGAQLDYDLNYPGQIRRIMNADAADLISLTAARNSGEEYKPARFKLRNTSNAWQYSRLSWFAMVAPTSKDRVHSLQSFGLANPETTTKNLFQQPFEVGSELLTGTAVGSTLSAIVRDPTYENVQQYQRLRSASFFEQPAHWLSKDVYKKHYSARILGRRAVSRLSSACLVRDTE